MKRWKSPLPAILAAVLSLAITAAANAQVTLLGEYRLGENDPGAVVGGAGNAMTIDNAGTPDNLTKAGRPTYAANSVVGVGSLSMNFNGGGDNYFSGAVLPTAHK